MVCIFQETRNRGTDFYKSIIITRLPKNKIKQYRIIKRGCTRLADMLPSKYEDNTLQIKEKSTERTAPV
ncbi:hypothetical protein ACTHSL_06435, partial [Neisseria sp. P0008.S010]